MAERGFAGIAFVGPSSANPSGADAYRDPGQGTDRDPMTARKTTRRKPTASDAARARAREPLEQLRRPKRIFALDLGTTKAHPVGWAFAVGDAVQSGQVSIEARGRTSRPRRFEYFRDWYLERLEELGPDMVAYEMPPLAKGGLQGRLALLGLVVLIEEASSRWGLDPLAAAPATVKKVVTGKGDASKERVSFEIERRYPDQLPLEGPDQADALAVLEWARIDVLGLAPRGKAGKP